VRYLSEEINAYRKLADDLKQNQQLSELEKTVQVAQSNIAIQQTNHGERMGKPANHGEQLEKLANHRERMGQISQSW